MISATGLGSGLDITGLVDSLVAAERAGSDLQLNRQSARLQSKFTALGTLKSALSGFQTSLTGLTSFSSFSKNLASSSDSASLAVSAGSAASANSYSVEVTQLARSHNLATSAFATAGATAVGTGSVTFTFGTTDYDQGSDTYNGFVANDERSPVTIVIDSSNNTLQGIMKAINNADFGVRASIVNDGTGYRLLMTSVSTGQENSLQVTVADDDANNTDTSGLSSLAFNAGATNLEQTVAATDAALTINGLAITSARNQLDDAIEGLSLTLKQVTTSPVQITVQADTASIEKSVNAFIAGYNQLIQVVNSLSAYNPDTRQAAALVGDFTLRSIENQVGSILRSAIPLSGDSFTSLSELGITTSANGTLTLNQARFSEALADDPDRVMQIFAAFGTPTDGNVAFLGSGAKSVAGTYGVNITTLAAAGYNSGTSVLPDFGGGGTVVIDADNDNLTLSIDGIEGTISLAQGTYSSGAALAAELQSRINDATAFSDAGISVSVAYNVATNNLTITSGSLGSSSAVEIVSSDANVPATLGLLIGAGTTGVDVAGTIGGVAATGKGNILVAASGTDAEGLRLEINGSTLGDRGSVTFTRGVTSQLDSLLKNLLETDGALDSRINSFESRLDEVKDRREELELRWQAVRDRYTRQFNALDTLLGQLQNTSTFLEQQLGSLLEPNMLIDRRR